ncbi:UNVERIFIED_CONTAM: hypothetical protein FKN15_012857 [Acipenser sinensis]
MNAKIVIDVLLSLDKSATTKNPASAVVLGTIPNTVYSEVMNPVHSVTPNSVYSEVMNPVHSVTPNSVYSEVMNPVHSVTPNSVYSEVMKPVHSVTPNSVYSEVMKPVHSVTPNSVYSEVMKPVHSVTPNSVYSEVMKPVHSVTPNSVYSEAADVTQANDVVYSEVMKVTPDSDVATVYSNAGFEGKHDAKESVVYSVIGGLQFYASDKLDSSGLIDVFSSLSVSSGDFAAEVIQLTSDGKQTDAGKWFHGTIYLDSTVGNNTVFTITWQTDVPTILITSPNSESYSNGDLQIKTDLRIGRLTLPGTAQPGLWGYNILNSGRSQQSFTVTVNSRAVNECVPPITVNAEMNTESTSYPTPVIIYAEVNQGYTPVINANVTAIIELANTSTVELSLLDSGSGADAFKNDGVYSSYFFSFGGNGRYSLKIKVLGLGGTVKVTTREGNSLPYRSGYISQNGTVHFNKPPHANDTTSDVGSFSRSGKGSTLTVSKVPADPTDEFPPGRVTDLTASIVDDKIQLTWTAPGDDFDKGLETSQFGHLE